MQPHFDFYSIAGVIGIIQGLFLSFFLLVHRSDNRRANVLLALLLIILSVDLTGVIMDYTRYYLVFPDLYLVTDPLDWLIGPVLFLYVCALTQKHFTLKPIHLLHLIPSLLFWVLLIPFFVQDTDWKLAEITKSYQDRLSGAESQGELWGRILLALFFCTQPFVYIILSIRNLRRHAVTIREQFSSVEKINLQWLTRLLVIVMVLWCVWFVMFFKLSNDDDIILLPVLFSVVVYIIGYFGLRQPVIFSQTADTEPQKKYESSTLTADQSTIFLQRMIRAMETDQLYKNPELTLDKLANEIDCPGRHVSQIINEQLKQNFFDFVNQYRIEEAKKLIREKPEYTLLAIAYESGFNSKSSFNAAFKKHSGQTPSEYRRNPATD